MPPSYSTPSNIREIKGQLRKRDFVRQRSKRGVQPYELAPEEKAAIKALTKAIEAVEKIGFFDHDHRDQLLDSLYRGQEIVAQQARTERFDDVSVSRAGFDFGGTVRLFWRRNPS